MSPFIRLVPLAASLVATEAQQRVRDWKMMAIVSAIGAVLIITAYFCLIAALLHFLTPVLGPIGAALAIAGGSLGLALFLALVVMMRRASARRKVRARNESLRRLATTGLSLVPLLTRRHPMAAMMTAAILGVALAPGKSRQND